MRCCLSGRGLGNRTKSILAMIKLNDKAIAVEVPSDAHRFATQENKLFYVAAFNNFPRVQRMRELPDGDWKPLGLAHELNDDDYVKFIPEIYYETFIEELKSFQQVCVFPNYIDRLNTFPTRSESFRSLMESHGLDMKVKTYFILTKKD